MHPGSRIAPDASVITVASRQCARQSVRMARPVAFYGWRVVGAAWAVAREPWQLFAATSLSGAGWAAMSGAAVNAIVSPWFARTRPAALAMAYNGASVGGIVFSPLWVAAIGLMGFPIAAAV